MVFESTRSRSIRVRAEEAPHLIPNEIAVGEAVLRLRSADGEWSASGAAGPARVTFRALDAQTAEMTLTLTAPDGIDRLAWPKPRLARLADRFAPVLAWEIGLRAETGTDPIRARRVPAVRMASDMT